MTFSNLTFWAASVKWAACVFAGVLLAASAVSAAPPQTLARGGRVGWARLITEDPSWSVHSANDPILAAFIRKETSLNIDPICYPVDPANLDKLCAYPLVFTNNLTNVHDPKRLANIREYLKRGGFIYIDRCVNLSFSLEQEIFYSRHIEMFSSFLPGCEVRALPPEHEINRCYFTSQVLEAHLSDPRRREGHDGIYGVYYEGRMVMLLSLANFQCGWPKSDRARPAMEMIANIYIYAMTR